MRLTVIYMLHQTTQLISLNIYQYVSSNICAEYLLVFVKKAIIQNCFFVKFLYGESQNDLKKMAALKEVRFSTDYGISS